MPRQLYIWVSESICLNCLSLKSRAIIVWRLYVSILKLSLISAKADVISF